MEPGGHRPVAASADVELRDDKAADLLKLIKESLRERRFGLAVRLEVASTMPTEMVEYLTKSLNIEPDDVYRINGLLDVPDLMELYNLDLPDLKDKPLRALVPVPLRNKESLFEAIKKQDVLLHHPYSAFATVVDFDWCQSHDRLVPGDLLQRKISQRETVVVEIEEDRVGYLRLGFLWSTIPQIDLIWVDENCEKGVVGTGRRESLRRSPPRL